MIKNSVKDTFFSKVDKTDSCWIWNGVKSPGGYGVAYNGVGAQAAHRVAYRILIGEIPDGMQLDHLCQNRACVNPEHLEPVTPLENVLRSRMKITHCPKNHPYDLKNTYRKPSGARDCRKCRAEAVRRHYYRATRQDRIS